MSWGNKIIEEPFGMPPGNIGFRLFRHRNSSSTINRLHIQDFRVKGKETGCANYTFGALFAPNAMRKTLLLYIDKTKEACKVYEHGCVQYMNRTTAANQYRYQPAWKWSQVARYTLRHSVFEARLWRSPHARCWRHDMVVFETLSHTAKHSLFTFSTATAELISIRKKYGPQKPHIIIAVIGFFRLGKSLEQEGVCELY